MNPPIPGDAGTDRHLSPPPVTASSPRSIASARRKLSVEEVFSSDSEDSVIPEHVDTDLDPRVETDSPDGAESAEDVDLMGYEPIPLNPPAMCTRDESFEDDVVDPRAFKDAALEVPVPQVLEWIAAHSSCEIRRGELEPRAPRFRLQSQPPLPPSEEPFVALATSPDFIHAEAQYADAYVQHEVELGHDSPVGKYAPPKEIKKLSTAFRLGDALLRTDPPKQGATAPFLCQIKPNTVTRVRDMDLARLDTNARRTLAICNTFEGVLSALGNVYPTHHEAQPVIQRAVYLMATGLANMVDASIKSIHQIAVHRRDAALHPQSLSSATRLSREHLALLRHAPTLSNQQVFDAKMVSRVTDERKLARKESFIDAAARNLATQQRPSFRTPQPRPSGNANLSLQRKRPAQATGSQASAPKQPKYVAAPAKARPFTTPRPGQQSSR